MQIDKKTTLVLGASLKPQRYSNIAITRLRSNQVPVVALGLREGTVAGVDIQTGRPDLSDGIHTVTLYLNPSRQEEWYDYIVDLSPERVIFNPGTENPAFYEVLKKNNIQVEVACTLVMLSIGNY
jgi:predicted CoA-binding protein